MLSLGSTGQEINAFNYNFTGYTVTDGLKDNTIVKSVADKHGFLWLATHNGVSRFDGQQFKTYTYDPKDSTSLRSIWVSDITRDATGKIWASTEGGLCYYDESQDRFIYVNNRKELQLVFKMPLCNDFPNTIWIAAEDGLKKVDTRTKKISSTSLSRIVDPQFVTRINDQQLLIGTRGYGLIKYDVNRDEYHPVLLPGMPADIHLMDALQEGNYIWIASSEGLVKLYADEKYTLYNRATAGISTEPVEALMCVNRFTAGPGDGYLICGSYDKKLLLFNRATHEFSYRWQSDNSTRNSFSSSIVYNLFADKKKLWISTNRGLQLVNLESQQQQTYFIPELRDKDNYNFVRKAVFDKAGQHQKIWLIPWEPMNGLMLYDLPSKKMLQQWGNSPGKNAVHYLDLFSSAVYPHLVAAANGRLDFYSMEKGLIRSVPIPGFPNCIVENKDGNIWVGLDDGLAYVDVRTNAVEKIPYRFDGTDFENHAFGGPFPVNDIAFAEDGSLWFTSFKYGLFNFNPATKLMTPHRQKQLTPFSTYNRTSSLRIAHPDSIWLGTFSGLVCYLPKQQRFINFDQVKTLKSAYLYSLVLDSHKNVWGRGNTDLFAYNPSNGNIASSIMPGELEIVNYMQRLSILDDKLLFGHNGGFSIIDTRNSCSNLPKHRKLISAR